MTPSLVADVYTLPDLLVRAADEIIDFCQGSVATFKVSRYVRFVTEWPMSATKIQKIKLREEIAKELAAG